MRTVLIDSLDGCGSYFTIRGKPQVVLRREVHPGPIRSSLIDHRGLRPGAALKLGGESPHALLDTSSTPLVIWQRPRFQTLTRESHEVGEAAFQRAALDQLQNVVSKSVGKGAHVPLHWTAWRNLGCEG